MPVKDNSVCRRMMKRCHCSTHLQHWCWQDGIGGAGRGSSLVLFGNFIYRSFRWMWFSGLCCYRLWYLASGTMVTAVVVVMVLAVIMMGVIVVMVMVVLAPVVMFVIVMLTMLVTTGFVAHSISRSSGNTRPTIVIAVAGWFAVRVWRRAIWWTFAFCRTFPKFSLFVKDAATLHTHACLSTRNSRHSTTERRSLFDFFLPMNSLSTTSAAHVMRFFSFRCRRRTVFSGLTAHIVPATELSAVAWNNN